ncbi:MAG: hypothetical protein K0R83_3014, partial [Caulobacter sp.]|nr:hypothetical protein [Caulobacter sp.]
MSLLNLGGLYRVSLTISELKGQFLDELARVYRTYEAAAPLLVRTGIDHRVPATMDDPYTYWLHILNQINLGLCADVPETFNLLVSAASELMPGNTILAELAGRAATVSRQAELPPAEWRLGSAIYLRYGDTLSEAEAAARAERIVSELRGRHPEIGRMSILFAGSGQCAVNLPDASVEAAARVIDALADEGLYVRGSRPPGQTRKPDDDTPSIAVDNVDRDTVYPSLIVEGPDQRRFELIDVPHSTAAGDIPRAVFSHYYNDQLQTRDRTGRPRALTVDVVGEDGRHRRLDANSSLSDSKVRANDVLHVAPEVTAGGVDPALRDDALVRVFAQIKAFVANERKAGRRIDLRANATFAPTLYLLSFDAPSWGPPSEVGGRPRPISNHEVRIELSADFPMVAPNVFWRTKIFHPNIHAESGFACLGA